MDIKIDKSIIDLINTKGVICKDVTDETFNVFTLLKLVLSNIEKDLKTKISDKRIKVRYRDTSTFEAEIKVCDDVLIFLMHTNALMLEPSSSINNTGYVTADPSRAICGMISIYNFLSDSFKYERRNDIGNLVARIFVNREKHFFLEGKKKLGLLFNNFSNNIITEESLLVIAENVIQYSLEIEPVAPSFESMKDISVNEVIDYSLQSSIESGKRVGYKFEKDIIDPDI